MRQLTLDPVQLFSDNGLVFQQFCYVSPKRYFHADLSLIISPGEYTKLPKDKFYALNTL